MNEPHDYEVGPWFECRVCFRPESNHLHFGITDEEWGTAVRETLIGPAVRTALDEHFRAVSGDSR